MPAKKVIVHTVCTGCGHPLQLDSLVTSVDCPSCHRHEPVDARAWRWVLADGDRTVLGGERVLGETRTGGVCCKACRATIDDATITAALSAAAPVFVCASCSSHVSLAPLPVGMARPEAWRDSLCSAVVGGTAPGGAGALLSVPCSNCGAPMQVDGTTNQPTCTYCGAQNRLSPEVERELDERRVPSFYLWTSPDDELDAELAAATRARRRSTIKSMSIPGVAFVSIAFVAVLFGPRLLAHKPFAGIASADAPCNGLSWACSADGRIELHCEQARLTVVNACKGPKGCRVLESGKRITCDYTVAGVHDPCDTHDDYTCSTDRKAELECDGSQWKVSATCRGPDGCRTTPEAHGHSRVHCDSFIAKAGDPCNRHDAKACSTAHDAVFQCVNGQYEIMMTCRGPKGCTMAHDPVAGMTTLHCDANLAKVGDACVKGDHACRLDKKALLQCSADSRFELVKTCARGCDATRDHPACR
jgi:DNA-directed RNA polymerase subunit RPC12/RpoP